MVYTERAQRWHQFHVASAIQPNSAVSTTLRWIIQTRFAKTVTQGRMRLERIESARKQRIALNKSDLSIGKRKNTFKFSTSEEMCFKSLRRVLIMKTWCHIKLYCLFLQAWVMTKINISHISKFTKSLTFPVNSRNSYKKFHEIPRIFREFKKMPEWN